MSGIRKLVLISLADQCNDEGLCWPSVASITRRTGLCERAVRTVLAWLEEASALRREFRSGHSTHYIVTPARYAPLHGVPPAPRAPTPARGATPPLPRHAPPGGHVVPPEPSVEPSKKRKRSVKTDLPDGFGVSERVRTWAEAKGHGQLDRRLEHFIGYGKRSGKQYADWDEAFMSAVRENWAKLDASVPDYMRGAI